MEATAVLRDGRITDFLARNAGKGRHRDQTRAFPLSFGQRNDSIIPQWLGEQATAERIARIGTAKEELYRDLVRTNGMRPLPGVARWLHRLHEQRWLQARFGSATSEH